MKAPLRPHLERLAAKAKRPKATTAQEFGFLVASECQHCQITLYNTGLSGNKDPIACGKLYNSLSLFLVD